MIHLVNLGEDAIYTVSRDGLIHTIETKKIIVHVPIPGSLTHTPLLLFAMSEKSSAAALNPLTIAKLLGPSTPLLDRIVRFLNTVRGTDKVLMVRLRIPSIVLLLCSRHNLRSLMSLSFTG